jgi:NADPH-dependent F420 reductase
MLDDGAAIAVLGGTGALGSGLSRRLARAGFAVILGSRDPARAQVTADALNAAVGGSRVRCATYEAAAAAATVAILAVPFDLQSEILEAVSGQLFGKILIDCTVPLRPPKVGTVQMPPHGSAAKKAQAILGDGVAIVSAFQNVSAALLQRDDSLIQCDVLVCSDNANARKIGVQLASAVGLRGIEAGPLANSVAAEALTSILITINRLYKADHAGIRITGLAETILL